MILPEREGRSVDWLYLKHRILAAVQAKLPSGIFLEDLGCQHETTLVTTCM